MVKNTLVTHKFTDLLPTHTHPHHGYVLGGVEVKMDHTIHKDSIFTDNVLSKNV